MEQNFHWIQWIQGIWQIIEEWIGLHLKILSLKVSCWHCGSILVSYTSGGRFKLLMTNIFVIDFTEFSENI